MPGAPYPQQIIARITYTPTVNLSPSSLRQLFELNLPIIEDLTLDHVKASTISELRKYLRLYECTSTLRRPYSKLEFVRYFNRLFECRPFDIPMDDGIHQCIRKVVGSAIATEQALLLGSRVKQVAKYLSAETWDSNPDEDFVQFAELLAGMADGSNPSESVTSVFGAFSEFGKTRCLQLARQSCSTGCAEFDRIEIYEC